MAPPRDARQLAREARKAAPDTAGRYSLLGSIVDRCYATLSVYLKCVYISVSLLQALALCQVVLQKRAG